ncbi:hypothetical protein TYRP_020678 [Tyrophagus putrescentiae]|nr:hypothetical protein TYRP_020678 [Tyrophagus putrescentiae]
MQLVEKCSQLVAHMCCLVDLAVKAVRTEWRWSPPETFSDAVARTAEMLALRTTVDDFRVAVHHMLLYFWNALPTFLPNWRCHDNDCTMSNSQLEEVEVPPFDPPVTLYNELRQEEQAAKLALSWLLFTYEHLETMDSALVSRFADLMTSLRLHMFAQAEAFIRYSQQGVMPTFCWGDLQSGNIIFIVNRAAVFEDNVAHNDLSTLVQYAEMFSFNSPLVITARSQMITLIRELIRNLRDRSVQEENMSAAFQNKEEAMMAAATNYMQALQMMSISTNRIIATAIANNH